MVGLELDEVLKAWIEDCVVNHRLWLKLEEAGLPTRLIDVGNSTDDYEDLRLITTTKESKGRWIALSYRWGQTNNHKTTTRTLEDHLRHIPFNNLPLTIQDTIRVTRGLDIRYL